jgi:hypothetical protein
MKSGDLQPDNGRSERSTITLRVAGKQEAIPARRSAIDYPRVVALCSNRLAGNSA